MPLQIFVANSHYHAVDRHFLNYRQTSKKKFQLLHYFLTITRFYQISYIKAQTKLSLLITNEKTNLN